MDRVPVVVCIDLEPDRRVLDRSDPGPLEGFEGLGGLIPPLRDRLAEAAGVPAHFTWTLRMDPQIAEVYGAPDWIAARYAHELRALGAAGDAIGLHPHNLRWCGEWVEDHTDDAWIEHCVGIGLDAYRAAFGRTCEIYRHGDFFMSTAIMNQIADAGVLIDLTVEQGLAPVPGPPSKRPAVSARPDLSRAPHHAYRPSRADFQVPDPDRDTALTVVPLTPGLAITPREVDGQLMPTGCSHSLALTDDPAEFARMLRVRLRQSDVTHLAFAMRAETALSPVAWATTLTNMTEIGAQLPGRHEWCTGREAADLLAPTASAPMIPEDPGPDAARAAIWVRGAEDPGYLAGGEPEALEILSRAASALAGGAESPDATGRAGDDVVPAAPLEWIDEERELVCPVCGVSGTAQRFLVARAPWRGGESGVLRCRYCRALVMEARPGAISDLPEHAIDNYIEHDAGIEAILVTLSTVEPRPGLRLLDVGCGYGFGLDLARFAWGWEGIGLDPWNLAMRGRDDLGLDIRSQLLRPDLDLGDEPFDVVLASETLEHVDEPLGFLRELRTRVHDDGVIVLSTPDADFVRPEHPAREILAMLGLGGHVFLVDAAGVERLFRRAGFRAVEVTSELGTLRVVASPSASGLRHSQPAAGPDLALLARYCDARSGAAPRDSALRVGMAARALRYFLHTGDWSAAETAHDRLRDCLLARHQLDLDDPDATMRNAVLSSVPMVAADAHLDTGLLELLVRGAPECAVLQFRAAAVAAHANSEGPSPAPARLELRALGYEALGHARVEPDRAPATLGQLRRVARELGIDAVEVDESCGRVFTELVAGGHYDAAEAARPYLTLPDGTVRDGVAIDRVRLDALFSVAMLALQRERATEAAAYFGLCRRLASLTDDPADRELADRARDHEVMALDQLTGADLIVPTAAPVPSVHVNGTRLGVTAVLPVYNGRRFLGHALASVVAQTEPPDELIIVDDGSSDGGVETIDRSTAPFPVRVVRQDRAGQSAARNRAVESARGDLIAFLDQDDAWHPDHLAALCAPLRDDPAVGWVYSDFDEIDGEGRTVTLSFLREHRVAHPRSSLTACVSEDLMVIPSASVIRRRTLESLGGFDEMLSGFEDDDLFVRAFRSGWRFVFDDRSLTSFRVHGSSSSANGRFAESRRYFSTKLQETVADDRRLNRYYFRDVIAPRFFRSSLDDYVRAVSERDWDTAARAWADLDHFAGFRRDHATLRWKTAIIRNPRRFRRMLRINGALPRSLRPAKNPALSLR